jgi:putative ABC transport system permease protein
VNGPLLLAWRHVSYHRGRTAILSGCLGLALYLPIAAAIVTHDYQQQLTHRATETPLIAGAPGNRFDLTLSTLYFQESELAGVPLSAASALSGSDFTDASLALAIPVHQRFTARGAPLVGVGFEYFGFRELRPADGTLPRALGDVLLGSELAMTWGLSPGDTLYSDPREVYDIARPSSLALSVCGVLAATGDPDDRVAFVDISTSSLLEGLLHGHDDASQDVDEALLLARTDSLVMVSPALIEHNGVTAENAASFHGHGDLDNLPLTAFILVPHDHKSATLLTSRINNGGQWQVVAPQSVISDLMGFVFRIKTLFDSVAALLVGTTALLVGLVLALSIRMRADEMTTLMRIGCSAKTVAKLHGFEVGFVVLLGGAMAATLLVLTLTWLPNLMTLLS